MNTTYLITNGRIVNEGAITDGDLAIADGRIVGINVPAPTGATVVDAAGGWVIPGMIDDQVHGSEPDRQSYRVATTAHLHQ